MPMPQRVVVFEVQLSADGELVLTKRLAPFPPTLRCPVIGVVDRDGIVIYARREVPHAQAH